MDEGYSICLNKWALDKSIKSELGLLLIISSLCAEKGYCYASNQYFAELFGISEVAVSQRIKKLEAKNYIEITYKKEGCKVISREIRLKLTLTDDLRKLKPTIKENLKENNTSNNNIPPIVPQGDDMPKEDVRPYNFEILWQEYPKKEGKPAAYRSYCSWLVGKKTPLGKRKLTNEEIDTAIQNYNNKIQKEHTEYKYIKQGSTFFNLGILDYLGDGTSD